MNPFSVLTSKIFAGLSLVLLLALGAQTLRASHYAQKAEQCEIGRKTDRAAYVQAQKDAEARAIADKQAREARSREQAERTDDDYQTALARARRAADAYRLRGQAAGRASGKPAGPADDHGPELPSGGTEDAVTVTRHDFDVMIENSVKIRQAWEWAKTLNQEPIPDPAF